MNFEISQKVVTSANGQTEKTILIFSKQLDPSLMKSLLDITNNEQFYNETVQVTPEDLYQYWSEIMRRAESGNESLLGLACYLSDIFKEKAQQYNQMSEDGKITFDHLNRVFTIGSKFVAYTTNNQMVGSIVHDTKIEKGMFGERYFVIIGKFTISTGKEFIQIEKDFAISDFRGLRNISDLPVRPLSGEEHNILQKRGDKFVKYCLGTHYLTYNGEMFKQSYYGPINFNAKGRVMVDVIGFKTMNPNYERYHNNRQVCNPNIPDELKFMTWPFVHGFSLSAKQWGEIYVENLEEIKFDENAFDCLVLDNNYKEMAKALVTNVNGSFTDIISGKSGGCIFLLQGVPGTGKTLTCEAIAELLHRPLYSITVGELGTNPETLEKKLSIILETANSWNAVILIDEADIFLEKRTQDDIHRNAMVGIFLRLLERHQGVLFLTTNRADSMDAAFRSRISIIIKYDELDEKSRYQIWNNLLKAANISLDDKTITHLSKYVINGRQIKNSIRMAQCLALSAKRYVTLEDFEKVIVMM
ncbi:AAA family ATPase [Catovirus CTV1]|uniref:AAA family ATPase n=1 Tax=Catovirus CTV1 TaxID=1977631 RepID=A0A1V0S9B7_9VIRU|nr:AAA family ATPase [Catovirus CTV1]